MALRLIAFIEEMIAHSNHCGGGEKMDLEMFHLHFNNLQVGRHKFIM